MWQELLTLLLGVLRKVWRLWWGAAGTLSTMSFHLCSLPPLKEEKWNLSLHNPHPGTWGPLGALCEASLCAPRFTPWEMLPSTSPMLGMKVHWPQGQGAAGLVQVQPRVSPMGSAEGAVP